MNGGPCTNSTYLSAFLVREVIKNLGLSLKCYQNLRKQSNTMTTAHGTDGEERKCQHNCEEFSFETSLSSAAYPNKNPFIRRNDFCYIFKVS